MMLHHLRSARSALEVASRAFDPAAGMGSDAVALLEELGELGAIRRLTDGMVAKAAKRVEDTAEHIDTLIAVRRSCAPG
jgi:copper homeostasis protein CutC